MKSENFNHLAVLRYVLWSHLLSGLCFVQIPVPVAILRQGCVKITTSSPKVKIICGAADRIEMLSIYYGYLQTFSEKCTAPTANCSNIFKTGSGLRTKGPYGQCSQSQSCDVAVGTLPDIGCTNVTPNFVLIEYNCVPPTDFIDLCGNDTNETSTTLHLAYFKRFSDAELQNCTCLISGSHTLTAVHAGIPANSCSSEHLVINWERRDNYENDRTITSGQESMINEDFKELRSSHITLVNTCRSLTPPVWFKIKPDNGATVQIQCGTSIETSSSTMPSSTITPVVTTSISATLTTRLTIDNNDTTKENTSDTNGTTEANTSDTNDTTEANTSDTNDTTEANTSDTNDTTEPTPGSTLSISSSTTGLKTTDTMSNLSLINKDKKVPVIVGSVVGGLVLFVIIIVLVFFVLRYKRRQKPPSELFGSDAAVDEAGSYGEMYDGKQQTYMNNAFEGGSSHYSLVKESEAVDGHSDNPRSAELSMEYDTLQPTSVFRTFPKQYKKTTEEQDGSVPIYDHTKHQTQTVRDSPGNDVKHSDYDVLESRANLNSSFDKVEVSQDDTYSHIAKDKKEPENKTAQLMPNPKNENDVNSYPEYATVSKNRAEEELPTGDGINGKESTGNTKGDNLYHILEIPNSQELPTVPDNESFG